MDTLDARRIALKVAAKLCDDVVRPDAEHVVAMAKTFEAYLTRGDTGEATPEKAPKAKPHKTGSA